MQKIFIIILSACYSITGFSQQNLEEIDSILAHSAELYSNFQDLESLKFAKKAYDLSLDSGSARQIAESSYSIAICLTSSQAYEEALNYIKIAIENCPKNEYYLLGSIHHAESNIYSYLGFDEVSNAKEHLAIQNFKKADGDKAKIMLSIAYLNLSNAFLVNQQLDSIEVNLQKAEQILSNLPKHEFFEAKCNFYYLKSQFMLSKDYKDSTLFYVNKAIDLREKHNNPSIYKELLSFGDYYKLTEKQKALDYYLKAVDNFKAYAPGYETDLMEVYNDIAKLYADLGDNKNEKKFLKKYVEIKDQYNLNQKKSFDHALNIIMSDKEKAYNNNLKRLIVAISISVLIIITLLFIYQKNRKEKRRIDLKLEAKNRRLNHWKMKHTMTK